METKKFDTLAVVGAYSGYLLEEKGFSKIHEVFNHLYPGIMTMGIAAMADQAKKFLGTELPSLRPFSDVKNGDWRGLAKEAVAALGPTLEVPGPACQIYPLDIELKAIAERMR